LETVIAAIHPDDRHKVEEIRAAVTNPAINSYRAEYRVIGIEDGVERWIRTQGCTYELGNPKAFIGTVLDITEQKRSEEALRDKEAMLQAAIDLVGLSVYSWDLLAGTADRDDRIKAIWGLPPEAKVDLALARSAVHPDDVSGLDAVIARATDPWVMASIGRNIGSSASRMGSSAGYRATARPPLWTGRVPSRIPSHRRRLPRRQVGLGDHHAA